MQMPDLHKLLRALPSDEWCEGESQLPNRTSTPFEAGSELLGHDYEAI